MGAGRTREQGDGRWSVVMADEYDEEFFRGLREGSLRSATVIVPLVVNLIRPRSVVDVGCGTGAWLATFARHGVEDYLGVDAFTPAGLLEIPPDRFVKADLARPLALGRFFDLAVSLEVAEHLPDSAARGFVESLTRLAPAVLFSAAIPGQGGTSHLNERWPEYWSGLFAEAGFDPIDVLRPRIWRDERVEAWYAQNTILYVARGAQGDFPGLQRAASVSDPPLAAVHPRLFAERDSRLGETMRAHAEATARVESLSEMLTNERQRHSAEVEALTARLARFRFMSEPSNMSARAYIRAFPRVVSGALRRLMQRVIRRIGPRRRSS